MAKREAIKASRSNDARSLDFVGDQLDDGRSFRAVKVLSPILKIRPVPKTLRCGNGSEFTNQIMGLWAYQLEGKLDSLDHENPRAMPISNRLGGLTEKMHKY